MTSCIENPRRVWFVLLACSVLFSSCSVYRGPRTADPSAPLPRSRIADEASRLESGDAIEIRFVDGSIVRRQFQAIQSDTLLSFSSRSGTRYEFSDSLESISGIQSKQLEPVRTGLVVVAVASVAFVITYLVRIATGPEMAP